MKVFVVESSWAEQDVQSAVDGVFADYHTALKSFALDGVPTVVDQPAQAADGATWTTTFWGDDQVSLLSQSEENWKLLTWHEVR